MELFVAGCSNSWTERATSCYVLNKHILFDCGEGTVKNIVKCLGQMAEKKVDHIFLTHFHADHILGIAPYIAGLSTDKRQVEKITIVGGKGLKKIIRKIIKDHIYKGKSNLMKSLNIIEIKDFSKTIMVDDLVITPQKLNHGNFLDIG